MTDPDRRAAAAIAAHLNAWRMANDADPPQPPAPVDATPLDDLAAALPDDHGLRRVASLVVLRRLAVAFETRAPSHAVWAALSAPERLLSDARRLAPRFRTLAMNGGLDPRPGDAYRLEDGRSARRSALEAALQTLETGGAAQPPALRRSDIVLARCGPFAGETGEMVVDAAVNHPRAGRAALWVLAHDDGATGRLHVSLEAAGIMRWSWAPDALAAKSAIAAEADDGIVDWPRLFERLLAALEGDPLHGDGVEALRIEGTWREVSAREALHDALRLHPALRETAAALDVLA